MSFDIIQLAPLAIVLPFLGAALSLVLVRCNRAQRFVAIVSLSLTLLAECLVLATAWESAPTSINIAGWQAPFGIVLVVDQLSAIMLVVSTLVSLAVLLFATRMIGIQRRPQSLSERDTLAARRRTHIQHSLARLDIKALGS